MRHTFYTRFCQVTNFIGMLAITTMAVAFFCFMFLIA